MSAHKYLRASFRELPFPELEGLTLSSLSMVQLCRWQALGPLTLAFRVLESRPHVTDLLSSFAVRTFGITVFQQCPGVMMCRPRKQTSPPEASEASDCEVASIELTGHWSCDMQLQCQGQLQPAVQSRASAWLSIQQVLRTKPLSHT